MTWEQERTPPISADSLLQSVAKLLREQGAPFEAQLLIQARPIVIHEEHDNWDGGTDVWDLELGLEIGLFSTLTAEQRTTSQAVVHAAADTFFTRHRNHLLREVRLVPIPEENESWRVDLPPTAASTPATNQAMSPSLFTLNASKPSRKPPKRRTPSSKTKEESAPPENDSHAKQQNPPRSNVGRAPSSTFLFQLAAGKIDIDAALVDVGKRTNDLLPRRHEDGAAGSMGKRFSEVLKKRLADGKYEPSKAYFVAVPKRAHTTRPAAVLTLEDRVVLTALVESLRERVEDKLVADSSLYWPRGRADANRNWAEFERAPLERGAKFVVTADIAGFYESIDHAVLAETLLSMTGRREVVDALVALLHVVMGQERGLPQGIDASDLLSTVYLSPLDAALLQEGLEYWRNGDDIRVGTQTYDNARRALAVLEEGVRRRRLLLNSSKSKLMTIRRYGSELDEVHETQQRVASKLHELRVAVLRTDGEVLDQALRTLKRRQLGWHLWYHEDVTIDEVLDEIRDHLKPEDVDVASALLDDTLAHGPRTPSPLSSAQFHARITASFRTLRAARSTRALPHCGALMDAHPDQTALVAGYMQSLPNEAAQEVATIAAEVFATARYRTALEEAWLVRLMRRAPDELSETVIERVRLLASQESANWIARAESLQLMAACGSLDEAEFRSSWRNAPWVFRGEVFAAAVIMDAKGKAWANAFVEASVTEPLLNFVRSRVGVRS